MREVATLLGFIADRIQAGTLTSVCLNVEARDDVDREFAALRSLPGVDDYCHKPWDTEANGREWRQALVYFDTPGVSVTISSPHEPKTEAETQSDTQEVA